MKRIKINK